MYRIVNKLIAILEVVHLTRRETLLAAMTYDFITLAFWPPTRDFPFGDPQTEFTAQGSHQEIVTREDKAGLTKLGMTALSSVLM